MMLTRENALRLAPETQRAYEKAEAGSLRVTDEVLGDDDAFARCKDWLEVTDELQRRVVREFASRGDFGDAEPGFREERALRALRSATNWYPSLRCIPLYVRFNRARTGALQVDSVLPNPHVLGLDGVPFELRSMLATRGKRRTLLVAGSVS